MGAVIQELHLPILNEKVAESVVHCHRYRWVHGRVLDITVKTPPGFPILLGPELVSSATSRTFESPDFLGVI